MPDYQPVDGDIVEDLNHPKYTGMVCGGARIRDGATGVWVEWERSTWAADFEPAPYTRIGRVLSTQADRDEEDRARRRADEADRAARRAYVDEVRRAVEPTLASIAASQWTPDHMWHSHRPIEGIDLRKDGHRTDLIVDGYVVGHAVWKSGPELGHSGDCRLCGDLRLFDVASEGGALNGVQSHLMFAHTDAAKPKSQPCTPPVKAAQ